MNYKESMKHFITCEVCNGNRVQCFAKLDDGHWVAVLDNGDLDGAEMAAADFNDVLETLEALGASIRFTNHSAA